MMSKLMKLAEQAVDAYARAVALMDKPEQKNARTQFCKTWLTIARPRKRSRNLPRYTKSFTTIPTKV